MFTVKVTCEELSGTSPLRREAEHKPESAKEPLEEAFTPQKLWRLRETAEATVLKVGAQLPRCGAWRRQACLPRLWVDEAAWQLIKGSRSCVPTMCHGRTYHVDGGSQKGHPPPPP